MFGENGIIPEAEPRNGLQGDFRTAFFFSIYKDFGMSAVCQAPGQPRDGGGGGVSMSETKRPLTSGGERPGEGRQTLIQPSYQQGRR